LKADKNLTKLAKHYTSENYTSGNYLTEIYSAEQIVAKRDHPNQAIIDQPIPMVLLHSCGQRFRFSVDRAWVKYLPQLFNDWEGVQKHRFNNLSCSLVVCLGPGVDPTAWQIQQEHAFYQLSKAVSTPPCTSAGPHPGELPTLIADGTQDEIAAALARTRLDLLPPRLRLPLLALGATLLAIPLELPLAPLFLLVLLAGGRCFGRAGTSLVRHRRLNVDVLDALAVVLHSIEGFFFGPALMLTMIEGGESIRDATARIAHASTRSLKADMHRQVTLRRGPDILTLELADVQKGDVVLIFAGDQVPVDGTVLMGQSSLDVRSLTGESVPRFVETGDEVLASSVLLEGSLEIATTAIGDDTRAGQIAQLLQDAPVCDSRVGNYAAQVADRFVLPTLGLSLLTFGLWGSLSQAASLLMLDLGTGLRVSVPTAILASLNGAASRGILIRSGRALEALAEVDVVVFDKTGTLTTGEPALLHIEILDARYNADDLLQLAASAEQGLNHPIALAITAAAQGQGLAMLPVQDWRCEIGRGVCAQQEGRRVLVGNRRLLREEGIDPPPLSRKPELRIATPIMVAVDGRLAGVLYVADQLRPDAIELLEALKQRGISSHLLTGDAEAVALQVGGQLGLSRSQIHAEALPDIKAEVVRRLKAEGHRVAFVGDGINDSAALAYADVAVSFRHGSDMARETAEIVLGGGQISQLLEAYELARFSFAVVRQNILLVAVPNLTALVIGVFLPIPALLAILINNGSCIIAALNALRPLRHGSVQAHGPSLAAAEPSNLPDNPPAAPAPSKSQEPLNLRALAQRLGVSSQQLVAKRHKPDFSSWTARQDPQQLAWRYEPIERFFHLEESLSPQG
jgi:heavy metal translocating P-type ATPase